MAHGHVTDVVGRLRVVRRSTASRPGWLRHRRVGGAGENPRTYVALTSHLNGERTKKPISLFYPVISVFSVIQLLFLGSYLEKLLAAAVPACQMAPGLRRMVAQ